MLRRVHGRAHGGMLVLLVMLFALNGSLRISHGALAMPAGGDDTSRTKWWPMRQSSAPTGLKRTSSKRARFLPKLNIGGTSSGNPDGSTSDSKPPPPVPADNDSSSSDDRPSYPKGFPEAGTTSDQVSGTSVNSVDSWGYYSRNNQPDDEARSLVSTSVPASPVGAGQQEGNEPPTVMERSSSLSASIPHPPQISEGAWFEGALTGSPTVMPSPLAASPDKDSMPPLSLSGDPGTAAASPPNGPSSAGESMTPLWPQSPQSPSFPLPSIPEEEAPAKAPEPETRRARDSTPAIRPSRSVSSGSTSSMPGSTASNTAGGAWRPPLLRSTTASADGGPPSKPKRSLTIGATPWSSQPVGQHMSSSDIDPSRNGDASDAPGLRPLPDGSIHPLLQLGSIDGVMKLPPGSHSSSRSNSISDRRGSVTTDATPLDWRTVEVTQALRHYVYKLIKTNLDDSTVDDWRQMLNMPNTRAELFKLVLKGDPSSVDQFLKIPQNSAAEMPSRDLTAMSKSVQSLFVLFLFAESVTTPLPDTLDPTLTNILDAHGALIHSLGALVTLREVTFQVRTASKAKSVLSQVPKEATSGESDIVTYQAINGDELDNILSKSSPLGTPLGTPFGTPLGTPFSSPGSTPLGSPTASRRSSMIWPNSPNSPLTLSPTNETPTSPTSSSSRPGSPELQRRPSIRSFTSLRRNRSRHESTQAGPGAKGQPPRRSTSLGALDWFVSSIRGRRASAADTSTDPLAASTPSLAAASASSLMTTPRSSRPVTPPPAPSLTGQKEAQLWKTLVEVFARCVERAPLPPDPVARVSVLMGALATAQQATHKLLDEPTPLEGNLLPNGSDQPATMTFAECVRALSTFKLVIEKYQADVQTKRKTSILAYRNTLNKAATQMRSPTVDVTWMTDLLENRMPTTGAAHPPARPLGQLEIVRAELHALRQRGTTL